MRVQKSNQVNIQIHRITDKIQEDLNKLCHIKKIEITDVIIRFINVCVYWCVKCKCLKSLFM